MRQQTGEYFGDGFPVSFEHDRSPDLELQLIEWELAQQEKTASYQEPQGEQ